MSDKVRGAFLEWATQIKQEALKAKLSRVLIIIPPTQVLLAEEIIGSEFVPAPRKPKVTITLVCSRYVSLPQAIGLKRVGVTLLAGAPLALLGA